MIEELQQLADLLNKHADRLIFEEGRTRFTLVGPVRVIGARTDDPGVVVQISEEFL